MRPATDRFGKALAHSLKRGDTVLLAGQIGAGKTCLARAAIAALHIKMGQPEPEVPSPTSRWFKLTNCLDSRFGTRISTVWPKLPK